MNALKKRELHAKHVVMLEGAWNHARAIGLPLNEHITFRLGDSDRRDRRVVFKALRDKLGAYARAHGFEICFLWTRETDPDNRSPSGGEHMHVLMHVPPHLRADFIATVQWKAPSKKTRRRNWLEGWRAIHVTLGGAHYETTHYGDGKPAGDILRYICNQLTPEAARELGIQRKPGGKGVIIGKRGGCTVNIGKTAQAASVVG